MSELGGRQDALTQQSRSTVREVTVRVPLLSLAFCVWLTSGTVPVRAQESPAHASRKVGAQTPDPGVQAIRFAFREGPAALYLVAEDAATGKRLNERLFRLQGDGPAGYEDFGLTWLADCRRLVHSSGSFGAGVNNYWLSAYREDLRGDWGAEAGNCALAGGVLVADAWDSLRDTATGDWAGLIGLAPATGKLLWWRTGSLWVSSRSSGCILAKDSRTADQCTTLTLLRPSDGRVLARFRTENSKETAIARPVGRGGPPASLTSEGRAAGRGPLSSSADGRLRPRPAWAVPVPSRSRVQLLDAGREHLAIVLTTTRMADSDEVWGIALASGKVAWKHRYPSGALILPEYRRWVSPALGMSRDHPRLYIEFETIPGNLEHRLVALDWRTGRELWRLEQYGWEILPSDRVWTHTIQGGESASRVRAGSTGRVLAGVGADEVPASSPIYTTTAAYNEEREANEYRLQRSTGEECTIRRGKPYASGVNLKELEVVAESSGQTVLVREQAAGRFALRGFGPDLAQRWVKPAGFFDLVSGVVVAEAWQAQQDAQAGTWAGLVGLAPTTGKTLWRRAKPSEQYKFLAGQWNGQALATHFHPERGGATALLGLRPRDGSELWRLALPPAPPHTVFQCGACGHWLVLLVPKPDASYELRAYISR